MSKSNKETAKEIWRFLGATELVADGNVSPIPWRKETSGSGSPAVAPSGYSQDLEVSAGSQTAAIHMSDKGPFTIEQLKRIEFLFYADMPTTDTNVDMYMGLCIAKNNDPAAMTQFLRFKISSGGALKIENRVTSGSVENLNIPTSLVPVNEWLHGSIDFNQPGPAINQGGVIPGGKETDVRFSIGDPSNVNAKQQVALQTRFDMTGVTGFLQPFAMVVSGSAPAAARKLQIKQVVAEFNLN